MCLAVAGPAHVSKAPNGEDKLTGEELGRRVAPFAAKLKK
jgi:hypothetical protein